MYKVFKQVWNQGVATLQYVKEYKTEAEARAEAKKVKGIVKLNGTVCYDLTGYTRSLK